MHRRRFLTAAAGAATLAAAGRLAAPALAQGAAARTLRFVPHEDLEAEGYGQYKKLFDGPVTEKEVTP